MNSKGNPEVKEYLKTNYKNIKNEITNLTRQSKKDYYKQYFTENLQKIWKGIKEIINIKSKNYTQPTCIIEKNQIITEPKQIADSFNKYYASVAEEIIKERKYEGNKSHTEYLSNPSEQTFAIYEGNKSHTEYLSNPSEQTFAIYECDKIEIEYIIQTLNPRKTIGPNSILTEILHLLKTEISYPLSVIFNISLRTGTHPELLKTAKILPIFKKGTQLSKNNYRPISLLSNLNKILEKLMFTRAYNFLEKNNIIYKLQFGFRKKHSLTSQKIYTESLRQWKICMWNFYRSPESV